MRILPLATLLLFGLLYGSVEAAEPAATKADTERGDKLLAEYFKLETAKLAQATFADIHTLHDWTSRRPEYLRQLHEMLGLDPLPDRTPLHAETTGKIDADGFTVEKVVYQSRPGLYVTATLYLPKDTTKPVPAILYLCGHGSKKIDGVSYGNKVTYQHHGIWFARHGYACLTIDTLQMGEIEGLHHGTKWYNMWWWINRGYTPAGVEAWNGIRALDYLQSRPEVDGERIGLTGRSGGGASSWYLAAIDERVKVAVPVAGIADLEAHIVDGVVAGHCDCMFMLNTYRWDYGRLAALVAPRPLLLANTDKDVIFPLTSIERIHQQVKRIYELYGAGDKFGLQISEGPHMDIPELQVAAFRWFDRFLMKTNRPIDPVEKDVLTPQQLKVLDGPRGDQVNTTIQDTFVPKAPPAPVPADAAAWSKQRDAWLTVLREKCFRGWPEHPGDLDLKEVAVAAHGNIALKTYEFTSQPGVRLKMYVLLRADLEESKQVTVDVFDQETWNDWLPQTRAMFSDAVRDEPATGVLPKSQQELLGSPLLINGPNIQGGDILVVVVPRGIGPTRWSLDSKRQVELGRRFMLLGQTLDGMRVWDMRRAVQALRTIPELKTASWELVGKRQFAPIVLYASLFEPNIARLDLWYMRSAHHFDMSLFNVERYLDLPQAVAMAAERSRVTLHIDSVDRWEYPQAVAAKLGWDEKQIEVLLPAKK